jgi:hypothetical protein
MRSGASLSILNVKSQHAMQDASLPLPTQLTSGRARCFCAAEIDTVAARLHTQAGWSAAPDRSRRPQGAMDLRAGSPATERRTGSRPLRGAILARPPPPRAHDHDCLRFPPASPAQNRKAGKKNQRAATATSLASGASGHPRTHHSTTTAPMPAEG